MTLTELVSLLSTRARSAIAKADGPFEALVSEVMRIAVQRCAFERGLAGEDQRISGRLFAGARAKVDFDVSDVEGLTPEVVGGLFEALLAEHSQRRRQSGSFYTPGALTAVVTERALAGLIGDRERLSRLAVCDPALGAGAFLIEAGAQLTAALVATGRFDERAARRHVALNCLYGVDLNPLAVAVAEAALWLFVGDPALTPEQVGRGLHRGDALVGLPGSVEAPQELPSFDWPAAFPELFARGGFDLVIGNPPWVAYAGRAAQPIEPRKKAYFARKYRALRGYPTLHGLFVERATELAPRGVIALVVPSPIADLDGYRHVRQVLVERHRLGEPLLEFGQDAFESVTQPCFALIAAPREAGEAQETEPGRTWILSERQRLSGAAAEIEVPELLRALAKGPTLPPELFGEMGFQTTRVVSEQLLCRLPDPPPEYSYPLLEGRDVSEFRQGEPRLFLKPDAELLKRARCRLRPEPAYEAVRFVVRQTAKVTIAALHSGAPFRNTLLAGFDVAGFSPELCVGLLNSALYRAFHLSLRRDARQAAFPQVKIGHLRALPCPPEDVALRGRVAELALRATRHGIDAELRNALDTAVYDLFRSSAADRRQIGAFLEARAPELGHAAPC